MYARLDLECSAWRLAGKQAMLCRRVDNAAHGYAVLDFGDVDRELAVVIDEFLGSVEWIDEKEAAADPWQAPGGNFLFRDDRNVGKLLFESREDKALSFFIGVGDRRMVRFLASLSPVFIVAMMMTPASWAMRARVRNWCEGVASILSIP